MVELERLCTILVYRDTEIGCDAVALCAANCSFESFMVVSGLKFRFLSLIQWSENGGCGTQLSWANHMICWQTAVHWNSLGLLLLPPSSRSGLDQSGHWTPLSQPGLEETARWACGHGQVGVPCGRGRCRSTQVVPPRPRILLEHNLEWGGSLFR